MIESNDRATELYHQILLKSDDALQYLKDRGLNKDVLVSSKVGYANGEINIVSILKSEGLPYEHLATLNQDKDYFRNCIVLPLISLGHTRFFTSRSMPNRTPKHVHQRGRIEHFYNEDVLFGAKYVLVVESPLCCLTLKQNNINAIARLGGRNGDIDKISKATDVYIVPDIDANRAGEREAVRFGALLRHNQYKNVKIIYLSDDYSKKTDVNSFFLSNGVDDFRKLTRASVNIEEHRPVEDIDFKEELLKLRNKKTKVEVEHDVGDDLAFVRTLDIKKEISRYCAIVEYAGNYKCLCPFHTDSDPSLKIYPNNSWYCFSCEIGGDTIEFVRRIEEIGFKDALNLIIKRNK